MKKLLPFIIALALLLSACGEFAPEETAAPSAAPEYAFTPETYPAVAAGEAAGELARAVTAIMLGTDRTEAAQRVVSGTSAGAWEALGSGECALALAVDTGNIPAGVETEAVARDALVFYVSESNPVESLSLRDLEDIFDGDETSWAAFGGAEEDIVVIGREAGSGSVAALSALVGCDEALCTAVNEYQTAAGAIGFGFYYPCVVQGKADGYKLLAVEGVLPSAETVESGEYPLTAEYLAGVSASAAEGSPERTLFDWLCGSVGQAFISSQGYFAPQAADDAALGGEEAAE